MSVPGGRREPRATRPVCLVSCLFVSSHLVLARVGPSAPHSPVPEVWCIVMPPGTRSTTTPGSSHYPYRRLTSCYNLVHCRTAVEKTARPRVRPTGPLHPSGARQKIFTESFYKHGVLGHCSPFFCYSAVSIPPNLANGLPGVFLGGFPDLVYRAVIQLTTVRRVVTSTT